MVCNLNLTRGTCLLLGMPHACLCFHVSCVCGIYLFFLCSVWGLGSVGPFVANLASLLFPCFPLRWRCSSPRLSRTKGLFSSSLRKWDCPGSSIPQIPPSGRIIGTRKGASSNTPREGRTVLGSYLPTYVPTYLPTPFAASVLLRTPFC